MSESASIRAAMEVLDELQVPDDLRPIAFQFILDADKGQFGNHPVPKISSGRDAVVNGDVLDFLEQKAKSLGVDADSLSELFVESADGEVDLTLPNRAVTSDGIKSGLERIVLLLAFVRQGKQLEEFTAQDRFARAADEYGVRDSNFSKHMRSFSDFFQVQGTSGSRTYRLKRLGWERAAEIVSMLTEGEA